MMKSIPTILTLAAATTHALHIPLPLSDPLPAQHLAPNPKRQSTAPSYWTPPLKSNIQFILTGIPDIDDGYIKPDTGIYELDMFWTPGDTIAGLRELGQRSVCYFSAATAEEWRDDYKEFDKKDLGLELPDWKGERYLDIRRDNVLKVMKKRIDLAKEKGCDSIEPDNVDVYSNDNGFKPDILPSDTVAYLHKLSDYARNKGMSVGIKNCIEILGDIFDDVDFAISEECVQYLNCTVYANFTTAPRPGTVGKAVFEVEYVNYTYSGSWSADGVALDPSKFKTSNVNFPGLKDEKLRRKLCNLDEEGASLEKPYLGINTIIKTLELDGFVMFCDGSAAKSRTKNVEPDAQGPRVNRRSWVREQVWRKMGGAPFDP